MQPIFMPMIEGSVPFVLTNINFSCKCLPCFLNILFSPICIVSNWSLIPLFLSIEKLGLAQHTTLYQFNGLALATLEGFSKF